MGIDFGTSNSAAAYMVEGRVEVIELSEGESTLPTTFFFDFESRATLLGHAAVRSLLDGAEGRFMRALKRVLGTSLMHEPRQILNERVTFVQVIGHFLRHIKTRAEARTGVRFDRALSGRPVVFHGPNDPREDQAEADLRACYLAAGFQDVCFLAEPAAAALATGQKRGLGLIVDIGGGTSDFSLFRSDGSEIEILANHGVRIGGTDFDRSISIDHVMPLLGKGSQLRKEMGPGLSPVPNAIFHDLATWEMIPFLYGPKTRRQARELLQLAKSPEKLRRLERVLDHELGHDLAFATEAGKIAANDQDSSAKIDLALIEPGLAAPLVPAAMATSLERHRSALLQGARTILHQAQLGPNDVNQVIYVGGSSLMSFVREAMETYFPAADHRFGAVFTAVVDGLAIAAAKADAEHGSS